MRFQVLGPLRVWNGAGWSAINAPQQRILLAILLAEAGRSVSTDRLVDEIWGDRPPPTAVNTVQGYVVRLRRMTSAGGRSPLLTQGRGYQLALAEDDLDADVFTRSVEAANRHAAAGALEDAVAGLTEALALWRGPALADVPAVPAVATEAARLEYGRLAAVERRLTGLLDLGRHATAVDELQRLVELHPLRERFWGQLMLALYRCGRRTDALEAYRRGHDVLVAELGLEPGAPLRALRQAIADDAVEPPASPPSGRTTPHGSGAGSAGAGAPASGVVPAAGVVPAQLPADVAGFTGRAAQLERLDAALAGDAALTGPVAVTTIVGTAGVGKTALAVRWAHQVRDRFPDGQLYVNLRGYAAGPPVRPAEALALLLPALGVAAEHVPSDVEEAAGLYRSLLAGRRVLVLLDNAGHPDQVRPLLPGGPGCQVVVTSRDHLAGLVARDGAVRLSLDVLTRAESRTLLGGLLGAERLYAEPVATAELADLCGHLPLALRIAAANLTAHPGRTVAGYNARLGAEGLAALEVDGDPQATVRAAFGLSYATLPDAARRLFRLLGLVPGPDFTAPTAAALADLGEPAASRLLDRLAAAHLIEEHLPGRYGFHDLLRRYAAERASADPVAADREAARDRLHAHYLRGVEAAARLLYPQILRLPAETGTGAGAYFADHAQASAWLDAERANLVAAVTHAAQHGPVPAAWRLADALRGYLFLRRHTVDWLVVAEAGLAAAVAGEDPRAQAAAHLSLAMRHFVIASYEPAAEHYRTAGTLARAAGWLEGESAALGNLGMVSTVRGRLAEAADHYSRALAIDRRAGWRDGQATKLANLGYLYLAMGRPDLAAAHHARALDLHRATGSRSGEAMTLCDLGEAYHMQGRLEEALNSLTEARAVHGEVGDRSTEGSTIRIMAAVHRDAGRHVQALDLARGAVALARDVGDRRHEAEALTVQASVHHRLGQHRLAMAGHTEALGLARAAGNRYVEAEALIGLAAAYQEAGQPERAAARAAEALMIARAAGYRILEGQALTVLAAVHLDEGRPDLAVDRAEGALACHSETGHRLGAARTHAILDRALRGAGRDRAADRHGRRAAALFAAMGADGAGAHALAG